MSCWPRTKSGSCALVYPAASSIYLKTKQTVTVLLSLWVSSYTSKSLLCSSNRGMIFEDPQFRSCSILTFTWCASMKFDRCLVGTLPISILEKWLAFSLIYYLVAELGFVSVRRRFSQSKATTAVQPLTSSACFQTDSCQASSALSNYCCSQSMTQGKFL